MKILFLFFWTFCFLLSTKAQNTFICISYHDLQEIKSQSLDSQATTSQSLVDTITVDEMSRHFQWLKENGYNPISIDDILKAQQGKKNLPDKAILLTFDDGYQSFYKIVYPLLKAYDYPAILGIVGKWIDTPAVKKVTYGDKKLGREHFLTWPQIQEMNASGLVEIASHSYDHHRGILANPQGNLEPASTTRLYIKKQNRYETQSQYEKRIDQDLRKNSHVIKKHLGKKPRIMIWPYGRYNDATLRLAKKNGMPISMTLDEFVNDLTTSSLIGRYYYLRKKNLADFVNDIQRMQKPKRSILRSIRVDMDYIYDPDPVQCEKNLGALIERIYQYQINTVFIQGFSDKRAKGHAQELFFPNRHLPMKADLMNRVVWQLSTRTGVKVYAWMPLTAFNFQDERFLVKRIDPQTGQLSIDPHHYKRVCVFCEEGKQKIREIYEDLATHVPIEGIAFHDDGLLTDYEDAAPAAIAAQIKAGFPASIVEIRQDKAILHRWTRWKSKALIDFSQELTQILKKFHSSLKTNRNLFALPLLRPESEEWFAQNVEDFLQTYDHVALMAMPYMENHGDEASSWLVSLVEKIKEYPQGLDKTLFELQSVRWDQENKPLDSETLLQQMRLLSSKGVCSMGYYPDDFLKNHPDIHIVKEGISLQSDPSIPSIK